MYRCWFILNFLNLCLLFWTGSRFTRGKTYSKEEFASLADEAEWEKTRKAGLSGRLLWHDFWFTQVCTCIVIEKKYPIEISILFKIIFLHFFKFLFALWAICQYIYILFHTKSYVQIGVQNERQIHSILHCIMIID